MFMKAILAHGHGGHPAWTETLITAACFVGNYGEGTPVYQTVKDVLCSTLAAESAHPQLRSTVLQCVELLCGTAEGAQLFAQWEGGACAQQVSPGTCVLGAFS